MLEIDKSVLIFLMHVCRLEGVEVRLQETAEAFEQTRLLAKKTKAEFEMVKKQRYVCAPLPYVCQE